MINLIKIGQKLCKNVKFIIFSTVLIRNSSIYLNFHTQMFSIPTKSSHHNFLHQNVFIKHPKTRNSTLHGKHNNKKSFAITKIAIYRCEDLINRQFSFFLFIHSSLATCQVSHLRLDEEFSTTTLRSHEKHQK